MAAASKWERLRPLRPDTLRLSAVRSGRGREVPPGNGERAGLGWRLAPVAEGPEGGVRGAGRRCGQRAAGSGSRAGRCARGCPWLYSALVELNTL